MLTFLTKILTLSKLTDIEGTFKTEYVEEGNTYPCHTQGATPEETQFYEGQIGQLFMCYTIITCPAEISDKIYIDGIVYKCKGVKVSDFGSVKFKKLILASVDAVSDQNSES